ncbi:hypothetical protein STRAU_6402 [Streptomyces aurantiacus JA 4570]|uniref:Uncharacterized protein n=1 Tax=Streptomyces aurantiacus JA 4570 TaxID=1286094 RepID=S3ZBP5_9ACTN|nr:hypothetical protein STRAU_6402 [Streptomyces aurantiacus JA 4570]
MHTARKRRFRHTAGRNAAEQTENEAKATHSPGRASATVNVGHAERGHAEQRQLKGCARGGVTDRHAEKYG